MAQQRRPRSHRLHVTMTPCRALVITLLILAMSVAVVGVVAALTDVRRQLVHVLARLWDTGWLLGLALLLVGFAIVVAVRLGGSSRSR